MDFSDGFFFSFCFVLFYFFLWWAHIWFRKWKQRSPSHSICWLYPMITELKVNRTHLMEESLGCRMFRRLKWGDSVIHVWTLALYFIYQVCLTSIHYAIPGSCNIHYYLRLWSFRITIKMHFSIKYNLT